jgi:phosphate transport system permease protein
MAAASSRTARLKRADRAAAAVVTAGGALVIACVAGILVFIGLEAWPLLRPARARSLGAVALPAAVAEAPAGERLAVLGTDEHRRYLYTVEPDATVVLWNHETGARERAFPLPGLDGAAVVSAARGGTGGLLAAGTGDGRVGLAELRFRPIFREQTQVGVEAELRDRGVVALDPAGRPIGEVAVREAGGRTVVAGVVGGGTIALWWMDEAGESGRAAVAPAAPERITRVALGGTRVLAAGTDSGRIYYWDLEPDPVPSGVSVTGRAPVTALAWLLGDHTLVAGAADGGVSAWFEVRPAGAEAHTTYVRAHAFEAQGAPVTVIAASGRGKSFLTGGADGSLVLRHLTSRRTLVALPRQAGAIRAAAMTPKADGVVAAIAGGQLARLDVDSPHPEVTLQTLFGRVWYEGYAGPEFVWQSSGASDDVEPKLSLVPLLFGTIKGTVYALLFAVPLAVLGALYTSQFAHPHLRSRIKPAVEIMAALPSVVIGFLAGLWLAGIVERHLVAVILGVPLVLAAGTSGAILRALLEPAAGGPPAWRRARQWLAGRLPAGTEIVLILPLLVAGASLAAWLGPRVEAWLPGGDARLWLDAMGFTYDQRNCLVVGLAMGFAVVPVIFTIAEDAFSAVPSSLTAASLALGASRWQTAIRVVVPTASPGVFSAVMVGLGRAIGETMIVLMAAGNTPIMDWSPFNGMRTLSANIAVEIPEAPVGGTLYRVLFLSAVLLFALTFVLNTAAEIVRQRLRERYRAI